MSKSKFKLEYKHPKTRIVHITSLTDAFVLAVCPLGAGNPPGRFSGLNMCLVFSDTIKSEKRAYDDLVLNFKRKKIDVFTIYLCGKNGVKIPVEIHGGNVGSPTSCYFGYINPLMFDVGYQGRKWI